jgi:hypothetical protein
LPLALITLGVVFLLSNLVPERGRGGLFVLGLGAAFMIGRLTTGRYGYAVPAGILMAIGAHISLQDLGVTRGVASGGLFFMLLGLGFAAAYMIGLRPQAIWPLFPATVLIGLGLVLLGASSLGPLASFGWISAYWPVALVLLGVWLMFRDSLPIPLRRPIATLGGLGLLAYGIMAAAASVAAAGAFARSPGFSLAPGSAPFADTITLDQPISGGQTFTVKNLDGRTTIRGASDADSVHVVATRHFNFGGQPPNVQLSPTNDGLLLDAATSSRRPFAFGGSGSMEYTIDVPSGVAVNATTDSGQLSVSDLDGAVNVKSSSGQILLRDVTGEVRAGSTSGAIRGTGLQHVREAKSNSGSISLEGTFTDEAQIQASSGSVSLTLLPGSAVQLDVHTKSGRVEPRNRILLKGGVTQPNALTGALGEPANGAILSVNTSSGNVVISQ